MTRAEKEFEFSEECRPPGYIPYDRRSYLAGWRRRGELDRQILKDENLLALETAASKLDE